MRSIRRLLQASTKNLFMSKNVAQQKNNPFIGPKMLVIKIFAKKTSKKKIYHNNVHTVGGISLSSVQYTHQSLRCMKPQLSIKHWMKS